MTGCNLVRCICCPPNSSEKYGWNAMKDREGMFEKDFTSG